MLNPAIDVVMPVYNADRYLAGAVQSILQQSFGDFRLICVDDGCTDQSSEILDNFATSDSRLQIVRQENKGLVGALNAGLAACTAPLIARMDADDIAMPERFERQVSFLNSHPEVIAAGTGILEMDSDGDPLAVVQFAAEHDDIDAAMMRLSTGMAHPSVMMRREIVQSLGGYRAKYEWIEDLDLWLRLGEHGRLANLPDVLLCYRQHACSGSWSVGQTRDERIVSLVKETYTRRGLPIPEDLIRRCRTQRSRGGPLKWARKASKQGHWGIAYKHLRAQWQDAPLSLLTWRMTAEVALRSTTTKMLRGTTQLPEIPTYRDAA